MKTILIVEDDFHIQDIYRLAFLKTGKYTIETASDGQEALVKLRAHVYDLILLDVMLPKVTGIDVLRAMRSPSSTTRETPIILITNLGQEDIIKEAFKIGADGYLIKAQFTPMDVVAEVNAFFEQMDQMKQGASQTENLAPTNLPIPEQQGADANIIPQQTVATSASTVLPSSTISPAIPPAETGLPTIAPTNPQSTPAAMQSTPITADPVPSPSIPETTPNLSPSQPSQTPAESLIPTTPSPQEGTIDNTTPTPSNSSETSVDPNRGQS